MTDQQINPFATSLIRTIVPIIVGAAGTELIKLGVTFHGDIGPIVTAGVTAVYYTGARALEHFKSGKFGWLLGKPAAPVYTKETGS